MKNIGMIVAVEIASVLERYGTPHREESVWGFKVFRYDMAGSRLYVLNSGVGELAAAAAAQLLIDRYEVGLIVNFGVVGGLTEDMGELRTCVVEKLVHYDFDLSEIDPVEPGRYPGYDSAYIPMSPELVQKAVEIAPELKKATCASADKFVGTAEGKRALHEKYGADICEMEAAGIVLTCRRCGVPCLSIKTVSDGVDGGADAFYAQIRRSSELCLEITEKIILEML